MRHRLLAVVVVARLLAGCSFGGGNDELADFASRSGDLEYTHVGPLSDVDVSLANTAGPVAFVTVGQWEEEAVLGLQVVGPCDARCRAEFEAAAPPYGTDGAIATSPCDNCSAHQLFLLTESDGTVSMVPGEEAIELVAPIETPYEVMIAVGAPAGVRSDDQGWRAVTHRVVENCDPVVDRYVLWGVDDVGGAEELAAHDIVSRGECI